MEKAQRLAELERLCDRLSDEISRLSCLPFIPGTWSREQEPRRNLLVKRRAVLAGAWLMLYSGCEKNYTGAQNNTREDPGILGSSAKDITQPKTQR